LSFGAVVIGYNYEPTPDPKFGTQLTTRITSLNLTSTFTGKGYTEFKFEVVAEVWNKYNSSITIDHSDTCAFKVSINEYKIEGDARVYSGMGCGDAITPVTYKPGVIELNDYLFLAVEGVEISIIPDGYYELTYGEPSSWSYSGIVSMVKSILNVSEGQIEFESYLPPSDWGQIYDIVPPTISPPSDWPTTVHPNTTECLECTETVLDDKTNESESSDADLELDFKFVSALFGILFVTSIFIRKNRYN
jgi:hypothetical protein